ncbi:uncharacterized, partial [Tachysurus ichikawai]
VQEQPKHAFREGRPPSLRPGPRASFWTF